VTTAKPKAVAAGSTMIAGGNADTATSGDTTATRTDDGQVAISNAPAKDETTKSTTTTKKKSKKTTKKSD
jgi:hypothetical protein